LLPKTKPAALPDARYGWAAAAAMLSSLGKRASASCGLSYTRVVPPTLASEPSPSDASAALL
jgi:hypothetical protein